jgi:hypothetical protein
MKSMDRVISGSLLIIGLSLGFNAMACTPDGWSAKFNVPGNGETGSPLVVSRYANFCAYAVTGTSWVQSNGASNTRYFGRFYVLPDVNGSGTVDLLVAYSDEGGAEVNTLFKVSYDGADFIFNASGASGGSATATASSGWNLIEFEYDSDSSTFNYWVNEVWDFDTLSYAQTTGSFASGSGTVEAVQLGAPNGMASQSGTITFDAFESHRKTSIGALLTADANGSGVVTSGDATRILNEVSLGGTLSDGQPDCNENGSITSGDATCVLNIIAL